MKKVRLYRHPECSKCARLSRMHHFFDWKNCYEDSTEEPSSGPLAMGEVVVQDLSSGEIMFGLDGFKLLCQHIPAYTFNPLLLRIPAFRQYIEKEMGAGGCGDDVCELPIENNTNLS